MIEIPYKGLMPYQEEDAPYFFGRDGDCEIITANLIASRLTLLYGASGVGKSSVLHAGVVHGLNAEAQRGVEEFGSPEFVTVLHNDWRDEPVAGLLSSVRAALTNTPGLETGELEDVGSNDLAAMLHAWTERLDITLLIILDQFEEYFLYHPGVDRPGGFAAEFPKAVNDPALRVNFMISLREDALARLDRFKGRIPGLFDNYLRVDHLDIEAATAAIVEPVSQYNRERGERVLIEPALVDSVLAQLHAGQVIVGVGGRGTISPGGSDDMNARIETPYLQLVMTRLWREEMQAGSHTLRLTTLQHLGGAGRIVRTHLDTVMDTFPKAERDIAENCFRYLVTPSGTKIAHTAEDLAEYTSFPEAKVTEVLARLCSKEARVLRTAAPAPNQPGGVRYEIFHDVLAAAISDWRQRYVQTDVEQQAFVLQRGIQILRLAMIDVVAAAAVLLIVFFVLSLSLNGSSDPVAAELASLGTNIAPVELRKFPAQTDNKLRALLESDISRGLIDVTDIGGASLVRIPDALFASGTADVRSEGLPLLRRIGAALDELPGQVLITGHTDNVPIRSLRYPSNWHLSEQRARAVLAVLAAEVSPDRMRAEGRADTEPLVSNDSAANRAINRRVEIILRRSSQLP